jgi:hypothetical protein
LLLDVPHIIQGFLVRCQLIEEEKEVFLSPGKSGYTVAVFVNITTTIIFYKKFVKAGLNGWLKNEFS